MGSVGAAGGVPALGGGAWDGGRSAQGGGSSGGDSGGGGSEYCGHCDRRAPAGDCDDPEYKAGDSDFTSPACGDGHLNMAAGEQCDGGGVATVDCDPNCTVPECGDGYTNQAAGEACDARGDSPTCDSDCTAVECGDGHRNLAVEKCDDGDTLDDATCMRDCTLP